MDYSQVFNKAASVYGSNKFAPPGGVADMFKAPFGIPQGESMSNKVQQNDNQSQLLDTVQKENEFLKKQLQMAQKLGPGTSGGKPTGSTPDAVQTAMANVIKRLNTRIGRIKFSSEDLARLIKAGDAPPAASPATPYQPVYHPWWYSMLNTIGGHRGDGWDRFSTGWNNSLRQVGNSRIPVVAPLARTMSDIGAAIPLGPSRAGYRKMLSSGINLGNYFLQGVTLGRAPSLAGSLTGALKALPGAALMASSIESGSAPPRPALAPAAPAADSHFSWGRLLQFILSLIMGRSGQRPGAMPQPTPVGPATSALMGGGS